LPPLGKPAHYTHDLAGLDDGVNNVIAAAWICRLDYTPPKLTVVLDKITRVRVLIEKSGSFVIQITPAVLLRRSRTNRPPQ
jgi:flavin reductase (DIM6/NTAB) family NADH-FMN oxidoreductase RutF